MKSRSHRLPISEPRHDDWVDGSWTVDCICGVNYDDFEEMVDCDECGVWVHTRCSRYVKSEKSFACDKCKSKNNGSGGNDSEETEVAEFLVELPTKTLRMDNPNPESVSPRKPVRLWTNISMEERVHVQGVPGGDPGLFSGSAMSSIFGPELWKSTGYVPKKFNFKYTEFPCLGSGKVDGERDEGIGKENGEENGNQADNGAGVLFSLLNKKENRLPTPIIDSVGLKNPVEGRGCHKVLSPRQKKKLDGQNIENSMKKESRSVPIVLYSGKRKKEELRTSNDQNVKKKVRTTEKEGDSRKQAVNASKEASTFSSDAKHLEFSLDRVSKAVSDDIQHGKEFDGDQLLDGRVECATNLASNEQGVEATVGNDLSSDDLSKGRNSGDKVPLGSANFSETNNGIESLTEISGSRSTPVTEEVPGSGDVGGGTRNVGIGSQDKEPVAVNVRIPSKESQHSQDSDTDEANSRPIKKSKGDQVAHDHGHHPVESLPLNNAMQDTKKGTAQLAESLIDVFSEDVKANISSEATDPKVIDANRNLTGFISRIDNSDESPGNTYQSKREPTRTEDPVGPRIKLSGIKHNSEVADGLVKSNGSARSHSIASYQRKAVIPVVKSTSTEDDMMSKSSDNRVAATAQNTVQSKNKELSESSVGTIKGNASSDTVEHEEKCARPKKAKEPSMSKSLSRISESTKLSHTYDSKRPSDSKDPSILSSSKLPTVHTVASSRVSGECTSSQIEGALNLQHKAAASAVPSKGEKISQSNTHLSSRGNAASMNAPASSNVPATLSDEELALLLHQELNSSPRVPRVPRMRHAGSLPQLTSPSTTSVLIKQTSSGAGKDHGMASRRRTKDSSREGSRRSPEVDNEAKKMDRKPSSSDNRSRDSNHSVDLPSRRESDGALVKSMQSMKKKNVSSSLSSSGDANGHNISCSGPSSRHASGSGDDPRMGDRLTNRTLPGLLAEIMKEGKRTTYVELCNAVLPHWPHLRKHNGERYAYSSHSQAVLDCLRNRSEWARLVDRGPKTSTTRKRRKLDDDSVSIESEDNEENRVKNTKDGGSKSFESHQEDFPKGKRKTRKRRRLALQGRGIVRRRRRADVVSDDESESFSSSSEESVSSEEEIQGGGTATVGSEASASSDEVR